MQELSLNVLDIAQNSIKAGAKLVEITVSENVNVNQMVIEIKDDGSGMTAQQVESVTNPFFTTRTTRKVGLGVPLFKMAAEMTGGTFKITSALGAGTCVLATFVYDSIDRMPLGSMADTVVSLVQCNPSIDFVYKHSFDDKSFVMDTREFKQILGDVQMNDLSVLTFVKEFIVENYDEIKKGE